jgi:phage gpG-like protein
MSVEIQGLNALQSKIKALLKAGEDPTAIAMKIAWKIIEKAQDSFDVQKSAVDNSAWKPLSPKYAAQKRKRYGDKKILRRGEDLERALAGAKPTKTANGEVTIGLNVKSDKGYPYPAVHQFGGKNGLIPARPFLPIKENDEIATDTLREIDEALKDWVDEILGS